MKENTWKTYTFLEECNDETEGVDDDEVDVFTRMFVVDRGVLRIAFWDLESIVVAKGWFVLKNYSKRNTQQKSFR